MEQLAESAVEKSTRASILEKLKAPSVHGAGNKKKTHELEER
jgi:hypothetical protein